MGLQHRDAHGDASKGISDTIRGLAISAFHFSSNASLRTYLR
jgi:hypothetical protein